MWLWSIHILLLTPKSGSTLGTLGVLRLSGSVGAKAGTNQCESVSDLTNTDFFFASPFFSLKQKRMHNAVKKRGPHLLHFILFFPNIVENLQEGKYL